MRTDQPAYRLAAGQTEEQVSAYVRQVAGRLTTHRPDMDLTPTARLAVVQATTMSPPLAAALRARLPEITTPITRAAYAARLLQDLGGEAK
ncbi:hypothetical protein [Streptomyces sp. DSM 40484]|uniref:hypothetical protein n=1 Tax=Streptomyces kroppenstedtii TaxID=3051181 RepID=UPI0028D494C7|nr:hypothetical protein [Streptomyces sp. DSM 40484]